MSLLLISLLYGVLTSTLYDFSQFVIVQFMKNKYQKKYYEINKYAIRLKRQEYYQKHRDAILAKQREYEKAHPDRNRTYRENNSEKINARLRAKYAIDNAKYNLTQKELDEAPVCEVCQLNQYYTPEKELKKLRNHFICADHYKVLTLLRHSHGRKQTFQRMREYSLSITSIFTDIIDNLPMKSIDTY